MRTLFILFLLAAFGAASATFKDPRKLTPVAPLTQEEVARQQALQRQQSEVGVAPGKTDDTGYIAGPQNDPGSGAAIVASHAPGAESENDAAQTLKTNEETMSAQAEQPKKMAFGAIWALLAGLVVAAGAWAGLQKYGPKPPEHLLKGS